MQNFNAEMIEKAKMAKSAEELYEIAKANGVEMTADEAATYFAQINPKSGELNDDDLDSIAGGGCGNKANENNEKKIPYGDDNIKTCWVCSQCGNTSTVKRDWVPSTGGRSISAIPTYCGVCGKRVRCSTCQFCERRSDGDWCINPNRQ